MVVEISPAPGAPWRDGREGVDGMDGAPGAHGREGRDGVDGATWPVGPAGPSTTWGTLVNRPAWTAQILSTNRGPSMYPAEEANVQISVRNHVTP